MKNIRISICFGLICAVMLSFARFEAYCDDLRENVFRLHIIANSDSAEDQELKLKVRDAVLKISETYFIDATSGEEAAFMASENLQEIKNAAMNTVKENGFDYAVDIDVSKSYFENRRYENFMLPAGEYMSLNIKIGSAQGKNWWCVMFPAVCIGSSAKLSDGVNQQSANMAENPENYVFRFKTVEIYEDIKNYLKKY